MVSNKFEGMPLTLWSDTPISTQLHHRFQWEHFPDSQHQILLIVDHGTFAFSS